MRSAATSPGPALLATLLFANPLLADTVQLPTGTPVYGELDQRVTSKKRETTVGDILRAHAWRNVVVDGRTVIRAGAPMIVRVSVAKKAKLAGRRGQLELEAVSVRAVDGTDVLLDGGYDKSGHGRKALSISLAAVVAWPLVFIKGKQAVLDPGTVFDATVQADTQVEIDTSAPPKIRLDAEPALTVEVLYDEMDPEDKQRLLPVRLRACGKDVLSARIVTVNDRDIPPLAVELTETTRDGECAVVRATVRLKELGKHFRKGINRFEIEASGERAEVVLDIEL